MVGWHLRVRDEADRPSPWAAPPLTRNVCADHWRPASARLIPSHRAGAPRSCKRQGAGNRGVEPSSQPSLAAATYLNPYSSKQAAISAIGPTSSDLRGAPKSSAIWGTADVAGEQPPQPFFDPEWSSLRSSRQRMLALKTP